MEQIKLINVENVSDQEAEKYKARESVRAVVFDNEKKIGVLYSTIKHYYTLPGGGIETGETKEEALKRECKEEIGCNIEIVKELGFTLEYQKQNKLKQNSYCYIAKVVGEKGASSLTDDEIERGFETVWMSLKEAENKFQESVGSSDRLHMGPRNLAVVEVVKKFTSG
jgi:8-oxo-dGTP diphosphatase